MTAFDDAFPEPAFRRAGETALAAATSDRPRAVESLGRGNRKRTALVRFEERDPVVVQVCPEPRWLATESVLLGEISERTDVPVPRVLAAGATDGVAFLVTAYVPGEDLHERFVDLSRRRQRAVAGAFGASLGALHAAFSFDGYGELAVEDGALRARETDWYDWFVAYGRRVVERLPAEFDGLRDRLEAVLVEGATDRSPTARLFPWDLRPGNALVADGDLAAVLDWEAPLAAAPALSVAKASYLVADWYVDDPGPLREAFVAGYERVRPYPTVRSAHRVAAIADSAVDSRGTVTNPGYPERERDAAVAFHRSALADCL
ncbi:phosphotransferase family protein [Halorubellus salinus]|uniref:phosphotransferase family protein n=1 Tax=Halorubellus salinus TaxID=755309 RepID=UPI001D0815B0